MILKTGDMWSAFDEAELFLFTANSTLNGKGELVMGAGMAKQAKERFPFVPKVFGNGVDAMCGSGGDFYLLHSIGWQMGSDHKIGAFQVKNHWRLPADIGLIERSTTVLWWFAMKHPIAKIHLNYPGVGNGGLTIEQVEPIINNLPNNVTVWRYK